jgi:hypothetical protein
MHDAWLARFDGDDRIRGELTEVQPEAEGTSRVGCGGARRLVSVLCMCSWCSRDVVLDGV